MLEITKITHKAQVFFVMTIVPFEIVSFNYINLYFLHHQTQKGF